MIARHLLHLQLEVGGIQKGGVPSQLPPAI